MTFRSRRYLTHVKYIRIQEVIVVLATEEHGRETGRSRGRARIRNPDEQTRRPRLILLRPPERRLRKQRNVYLVHRVSAELSPGQGGGRRHSDGANDALADWHG